MKRIRSSLRQILVSFFLVYLAAVMLATDGCTRRTRATWPATYGWQGLHWATEPWLTAEHRAQLRQWNATGDHEISLWLQHDGLKEMFLCAP